MSFFDYILAVIPLLSILGACYIISEIGIYTAGGNLFQWTKSLAKLMGRRK